LRSVVITQGTRERHAHHPDYSSLARRVVSVMAWRRPGCGERPRQPPFETLPNIALQALHLLRGLCGDSPARGDLLALTSQATMAAEPREFAVSARLLAED
jgi:hypothetical protein